jgi:iron complex outermembrane receptor protein
MSVPMANPTATRRPAHPWWAIAFCLSQAAFSTASAAAMQPGAQDLKRLSIEELMQIDVTSPGRRTEPVGTAAAAVSVITSDDIRRAGVTTLADALALADGIHVARLNNSSWSVSARGFNGSTPNKLLVMVDGRTVYSPLFTGVFWNTADYVLEDIDRIEVIRGPGAALWGANAVNGVVNIITRHARESTGAYVNLSAGSEDRAIAEVRYGAISGATSWRVYGKFADRDDQRFSTDGGSGDPHRRGQAGFRVDGGDAARANWTLLGNAFHSREDLADRPRGEFTDLSLQARWSAQTFAASRLTVQSYYRREYRRVPLQLTHHVDAVDVDAQHSISLGPRHDVVWGGGARINTDNTHGSAVIRFTPTSRRYSVVSVFGQDEFALVPERAFLTAGLKYEHNGFSGGDLQPSVRARLMLPRAQMLWGAVSRAVRRPTRFDDDLEIRGTGGLLLVQGSDEFKSESLVASEVGYRTRPASVVSLEATAFIHRFADLRSQEAPLQGGLPVTLANTLEGQSHGVELGVNVQPFAWWRTHVGYTWLDTSISRDIGSRDLSGGVNEMNDPHHLLGVRTSADLPRRFEFDVVLRAVDDLPSPVVPAYAEMNVRLGWRATPRTDLWIVGHDLLHDQHPEFGPAAPRRVEFERGVRMGTTFRF